MSNLINQKRILVCTLVALGWGFFGSYIGAQISIKVHSNKCQTQPWGLKTVCNAWVAPKAIWQGSTTGLSIGLILGGFLGGLATHKLAEQSEAKTGETLAEAISLCADDLELTPAQRKALSRFLVLLAVKLVTTDTTFTSRPETVSLEDLQRLVALAKQQSLLKQDLTIEEVRQLLLK